MIELLMRPVAWLDALPRALVWSAVVAAGAAAGCLALAGWRPTAPPPPEHPDPCPDPLEALGEVIRAAESSPTARSDLAARLLQAAVVFWPPPRDAAQGPVPDAWWHDAPALDAVLGACPGVPPGDYRAQLAQALAELEACAEGRRR